jgi:hypothetical protein
MTELTQKRLKELLSYDPETGIFTNLTQRSKKIKIGNVAGCTDELGYKKIVLDGFIYRGHQLAWLYMNGKLPITSLDHINEIKNDNRICNLREITKSGNAQNILASQANNKSGFKGVCLNKNSGKYRSTININGKQISLGEHITPEEASEAYLKAKRELHTFWVENKVA